MAIATFSLRAYLPAEYENDMKVKQAALAREGGWPLVP